MWVSDKVLTLRDIGAYWSGMMDLTSPLIQLKDWRYGTIYTIDSEQNVYLDGKSWGKVGHLINMDVVEFGIEDDIFVIQLA